MLTNERLEEIAAALAETPESERDPADVAIAELLGEVKLLRDGLKELAAFASAHHTDEDSCRWLHALTVDIPYNVEHLLGEDGECTQSAEKCPPQPGEAVGREQPQAQDRGDF
jgi:hypothetical protein